MKKIICVFFCALILSVIMCMTAAADFGPKPSVNVSFRNIGSETFYFTLLSSVPDWGPWSAWDSEKDNARIYGDTPEDIWRAFVNYRDADGYYFLQEFWKVDESGQVSWGYYPPEKFKILLYYPDSGAFAVSGICERYAFSSYFEVDVSGFEVSQGGGNKELNVKRSYKWAREITALVFRIIVTVAIEMLIALLFGFLDRRELRFVLAVNAITQIALSVALNVINFRSGPAAFVSAYVALEFAVFAVEAFIYSVFVRRITDRPKTVLRCVIYAFVANLASFGAGLIAHYIGLF